MNFVDNDVLVIPRSVTVAPNTALNPNGFAAG
jgi:hypothetical protein